jgi:DNA-binding NarL/FixJ family response regulator
MIGRDRQFDTLTSLLDQTTPVGARVAVVSGQAGIGKTRLVTEFAAHASALGCPVVRGRCFELDRSVAFAPIRDLFAAHPDLSPDWRTINRESRTTSAVAEPAIGGVREVEKWELFRTVDAGVDALIDPIQENDSSPADPRARRPVLLLVEDVHWADEASLEWLAGFVHRLARPLVLAVTYRREEIHTALEACLAEFERARAVNIDLKPLSRRDVAEMIRAILGSSTPRVQLIDSVADLSDGNPLFVEEVLGSLLEAGDDAVAGPRVPRTVRLAVQRRANRLSSDAARLLRLAAVAGRRFDIQLLAVVEGRHEAELLPMVSELLAAELLVHQSKDVLAFRHALSRQAIYAWLTKREQAAMHGEVTAAREAIGDDSFDRMAAELSYHYFEAEMWDQAVSWAERAYEHTLAMHAPSAAAEHASRAIAAIEELHLSPAAEWFLKRGRALAWLGAFEDARGDFERALTLAQVDDDPHLEWQSLVDLGALWCERSFAGAGRLFEEALAVARRMGDPSSHAQTLSWIGFVAMMDDRPLEARHHQIEALAVFEKLGDQRRVAETLDHLGWTHYVCADLVASTAAYARAAQIQRKRNAPQGLASSLAGRATRGADYFQLPSVWPEPDAAAWLDDATGAVAYARTIGWRSGEARALIWYGLSLGVFGEYEQAFNAATEGLRISSTDHQVRYEATAHILLGALWLDLLSFERASLHLDQALRLAHQIHSSTIAATASSFKMSALIAMHDLESANVAMSVASNPQTLDSMPQRLMACARCELAIAEGRPNDALRLVDDLITSAPNFDTETVIPRLWLIRGRALMSASRWDEAVDVLEATAATARASGMRPLLWRTLVAIGRTLQVARRVDSAQVYYRDARQVVDDLVEDTPSGETRQGFKGAAHALMPDAIAGPPTSPSGHRLSRREWEVANLVARGSTNHEIAERLCISRRTVEKHIENARLKLNLRSRVQLAVWVVDQA